MNFVADESIDRRIVEQLRLSGHEVIYIAEVEPSITDVEVFDRANENNSLLITADKDFGDIVFRDRRLLSNGVILIRLAGLSAERKTGIVLEAISDHSEALENHFTVISPGRIRFNPN